jgi:LysR family transcriptional regulator, glycine cleavage system transcriptional activator
MSRPHSLEYLPLRALRAFEVAARYQSITRAADEMCVTQAAVSQQITLLEERLGVALFTRHHRGVRLTDDGRSLAAVLQQAFEQISMAIDRLQRKQQSKVLKLVLYPTLATRWLLPRLARFHDQFPDLSVQVTTSMQTVDFVNDDIDFSILYGDEMPRDVEGMPIMEEVLLPVSSPRYLGGATNHRDLDRCTLLHSTNRLADWSNWLRHAGIDPPARGSELTLGNSYLAYQAAIDGLGVAMAQFALVEQDLAEGRLVAPFPQRLATNRTYHLTYLATRKHLAKLVQFRDWIASEIQSPPAVVTGAG